jgi:hypothetical protein
VSFPLLAFFQFTLNFLFTMSFLFTVILALDRQPLQLVDRLVHQVAAGKPCRSQYVHESAVLIQELGPAPMELGPHFRHREAFVDGQPAQLGHGRRRQTVTRAGELKKNLILENIANFI